MYKNMSHLFVIRMKSHHTPPLRANKLRALHDTNGIQEPHMGCTKLLSEKTTDRYTSRINSTPFQDTCST
jgi:hypothetical protein